MAGVPETISTISSYGCDLKNVSSTMSHLLLACPMTQQVSSAGKMRYIRQSTTNTLWLLRVPFKTD
eukprot:scaffold4917_cov120-Cylindrotheca_fusiformis.AAC.8